MDVDKQVRYWRESATDDLEASGVLMEKGKINQGLFFAHLAVEKALKAVVCRVQQSTPPLTHNLPRLAQLSGLSLDPEQDRLLAQVTAYQLRGRYELPARPIVPASETAQLLKRIGELVQWLIQQ